jgi:hypothetical protein
MVFLMRQSAGFGQTFSRSRWAKGSRIDERLWGDTASSRLVADYADAIVNLADWSARR